MNVVSQEPKKAADTNLSFTSFNNTNKRRAKKVLYEVPQIVRPLDTSKPAYFYHSLLPHRDGV